jgi:hypothetical protein
MKRSCAATNQWQYKTQRKTEQKAQQKLKAASIELFAIE